MTNGLMTNADDLEGRPSCRNPRFAPEGPWGQQSNAKRHRALQGCGQWQGGVIANSRTHRFPNYLRHQTAPRHTPVQTCKWLPTNHWHPTVPLTNSLRPARSTQRTCDPARRDQILMAETIELQSTCRTCTTPDGHPNLRVTKRPDGRCECRRAPANR